MYIINWIFGISRKKCAKYLIAILKNIAWSLLIFFSVSKIFLTIWFPTTLEFCLSQRRVMWGFASSPPVLKEPPPEQLCTLVSTDQQQLLQKLRPISCAMYLFYDNHYFSWQVEIYFSPITTDFCRDKEFV